MKRLLVFSAILCSFSALAPTTLAAVGSNTFNVTATLSSACTVGAFSGNLAFGTVTAFVAPANPTPITSTITCTRTLTGITGVFDSGGSTASAAASATPSGSGVLDNGLQYTITGAFSAATAGTAATSAAIGTGDTRTFTLNGAMAAQAGTCTTGSCVATPQVRTLTLNF